MGVDIFCSLFTGESTISLFVMMLRLGFHRCSSLIGKVSLCSCLRIFIMSGCWILSNAFSHLWDDHLVFSLFFHTMVSYMNWVLNVKLTFHSWGKTLLVKMHYSIYCWIRCAKLWVRIFAIVFFRRVEIIIYMGYMIWF